MKGKLRLARFELTVCLWTARAGQATTLPWVCSTCDASGVTAPAMELRERLIGSEVHTCASIRTRKRRIKAFWRCYDGESAPTRERTGGRSHRLYRHELLIAGSKDLHIAIARKELYGNPTRPAGEREGRTRIE